MIPTDKIAELRGKFEYLEAQLAAGPSPDLLAQISKDYADLKPVMEVIERYETVTGGINEARDMLTDPEMKALAEDELASLEAELPGIEQDVLLALIPKEAADARPAVVEIRAGTGGDEAALFASDLVRMYQRYADGRGWRVETISLAETELGGTREAVFGLKGEGVFARMKFESGVHRVQRVPTTESGGRIHTSAATVAVLPEAQEVDLEIPQSDIRIDTMRASGAGGQHVNTTDSAVRITHLPTGIVVTSSEKSQHVNRERAMQVLRARLLDMKAQEALDARAADRKEQVGTGDRSERIRTYNFPQGRITDHRINLTLYRLDQVMAGDLDEVIDALTAADQAAKLAAMGV